MQSLLKDSLLPMLTGLAAVFFLSLGTSLIVCVDRLHRWKACCCRS